MSGGFRAMLWRAMAQFMMPKLRSRMVATLSSAPVGIRFSRPSSSSWWSSWRVSTPVMISSFTRRRESAPGADSVSRKTCCASSFNAAPLSSSSLRDSRKERISTASISFTLKPMRMSPSVRMARLSGKVLQMPPSTRVCMPMRTGTNIDGIEMLARTASMSGPSRKRTSSPV